jgi:hypothetical protein
MIVTVSQEYCLSMVRNHRVIVGTSREVNVLKKCVRALADRMFLLGEINAPLIINILRRLKSLMNATLENLFDLLAGSFGEKFLAYRFARKNS